MCLVAQIPAGESAGLLDRSVSVTLRLGGRCVIGQKGRDFARSAKGDPPRPGRIATVEEHPHGCERQLRV